MRQFILCLTCLMLPFVISASAEGPDANDLVWQKAVSKYDAQRASVLREAQKVTDAGAFKPDWQSLGNYRVPDWYRNAKFGIFIHWGLYSVPAFDSEWYPRNMYLQDSDDYAHHTKTFGPQIKFGYKDFIPAFKAQDFDARAWADLFRRAGAKYVVPVAEHHDGFPMYNSGLTDWSAAKMGPKKDVIGELASAVTSAGLHFGLSSHRAEHYFFMNGGRDFDSDVQDSRYADFYGPAHVGVTDKNHAEWAGHPDEAYLNDWLARTVELVDKYHPEVVWFDWWINTKEFAPYLKRFAAFYYDHAAQHGYTAAINYKYNAFPEGVAVLDIERGQLDAPRRLLWQTDTSISVKSWGYIEGDNFRSPESLVAQLVDIVSKNGCLLLNVGPKPDGTIPQQAQQILLAIGQWLQTNGEAIYNTQPWVTFGEGPTKVTGGAFNDTATGSYTSQDIRFTTDGSALYAIGLAWPADGKLLIKSLRTEGQRGPIRQLSLLGSKTKVQWNQGAQGLRVTLPKRNSGSFPYVLKIS